MAKCRFAYNNLAQYAERFPDYVFQSDGTTFTDYTEAARNPSTGDITATGSSTNHYLAVGFKTHKFYHIGLLIYTTGAGGTRNWEYWNGSAWTTFTATMLRGDKDFKTTTDYRIDGIWRVADVASWAKTSINGKTAYWIRFKVASTTNSPVFSRISNKTIIASSEELVLPVGQVGTDSPADVWKTRHETIEVIPGRNDKLDYDIGGSELTVTIAGGVYRAAAYASAWETGLGAGFTVEWSPVTGFTITAASGTLNLRCANGTNKAQSGYPMLGFDCSSNKTGALTYSSNYPKKSSGGSFTTTSSTTGEFNDGSNRSISLPAGNWNAGSLQAKVKQLADASGGGFTDFDLKYDEELFAFTFKRAGGNVSIINASPLFNTILKIADAGSAASHTGTTDIHKEEWFILTEPIANLNDIVLFNTNLQNTATVSLQHLSAADTWTTLGTFNNSNDRWQYDQLDAAAPDDAIYRVLISDVSNTDGFIQIGVVAAFDFGDGYFEVDETFDYSVSLFSREFSDSITSSSGQKTGTLQAISHGISLRFPEISNTDKENILTMAEQVGTISPILLIPDADSSNVIDEMRWVNLSSLPDVDMVEIQADDLSSATWTISMTLEDFI